jgi:tripartite-type tricarboxylate transporter receptor subunit TctC
VNALMALVLFALPAGGALAQTYPSKPVRIIVPFAAGGAVDSLARVLSAKLAEEFNQPVVVENRTGAGGNIGADAVAKSAPDGYTILQNTNGQAISPAIYRALPFDTVRDFMPVTQLVATATVLVANPKLPATSVGELVALAKAKPGSLNYGMTGVGNALHLTMETFKRAAGIDIQAIPYRGDAPLNAALIAGEIDVAIVPVATARPLIESGRLRALAVIGSKRVAAVLNLPPIPDDALPGFQSAGWQGYFVPANTPRDIVMTIQRAAATALSQPDVQERLKGFGNEPVGSTPEEFAQKFRADVATFARIVKDAQIPAQD